MSEPQPRKTPLLSPELTGSKRRAMSDKDKQYRRQAILEAALWVLLDTPFEQITVAQLADRLGLAKGTLYLYFSTKEALFLEVQQQQLTIWFDALEAALRQAPLLNPQELADLICGTILAQPVMPRLLTVLHTVLERNITQEQALTFKRFAYDRFSRAAALIEAKLPALASPPPSPPSPLAAPTSEPGVGTLPESNPAKTGQGIELLLRLHALVLGTWQMTDSSAVVRAAIATRSELAVFDLAFEHVLRGALRDLISGMAQPKSSLAPSQ